MILLIDDDQDFREGLAGALRDDGFEVREFAAAEEVPEPASLEGVQLVVTDYQLPGRNGLDFADLVHAAQPGLAIVLVTAHWSPRLETQVASRPFLTLRRKPLDYDEMQPLLHLARGT